MDRAFVDAAQRPIVIPDHTKWGVVGISSIALLERADVLVPTSACPGQPWTPWRATSHRSSGSASAEAGTDWTDWTDRTDRTD